MATDNLVLCCPLAIGLSGIEILFFATVDIKTRPNIDVVGMFFRPRKAKELLRVSVFTVLYPCKNDGGNSSLKTVSLAGTRSLLLFQSITIKIFLCRVKSRICWHPCILQWQIRVSVSVIWFILSPFKKRKMFSLQKLRIRDAKSSLSL